MESVLTHYTGMLDHGNLSFKEELKNLNHSIDMLILSIMNYSWHQFILFSLFDWLSQQLKKLLVLTDLNQVL